jgi:tetratricopeptide (TPR) repeat protein
MVQSLAKLTFVLLAIGLWFLACPAASAQVDDLSALNRQVSQLFQLGKIQEAIPIAERAVEVAKRARVPNPLETANALNNLGLLFRNRGKYAEALPLYQESLQILEKIRGPENPDTATSLNNLAVVYQELGLK